MSRQHRPITGNPDPAGSASSISQVNLYDTRGNPYLKDKHPNFIRGWNQVKFRNQGGPGKASKVQEGESAPDTRETERNTRNRA